MVNISGGNGSSKEDAVIIEAPKESIGIAAEYEVLAEIYGEKYHDWKLLKQTLIQDGNRSFDLITIEGKGIEYEVWFDITAFYGKY